MPTVVWVMDDGVIDLEDLPDPAAPPPAASLAPTVDKAGNPIPERYQETWRPGWRVGNSKARTARVTEQRRDVERIAKLAREEGYLEAIDELMPAVVSQNERLTELTNQILEASADEISKQYVPLLKTLLKERKDFIDRKFGTATQRQSIESKQLKATLDLNEMIRQEREQR